MITTTNYPTATKGIDFAKMPDALKNSHAKMPQLLAAYDKSDAIKKMVDLYLEKLNQLASSKPASKLEEVAKASPNVLLVRMPPPEVKKETATPKKAATQPPAKPKKAKPKKAAPKAKMAVVKEKVKKAARVNLPKTGKPKSGKKPAIRSKDLVRTFSDELAIVRRFAAMLGKTVSVKRWITFHRYLQKILADKKVHGNSVHAKLIEAISGKTAQVVEATKGVDNETVLVEASSDKFTKTIEKISKQTAVYPSVSLYKRYIGMQGEVPSQSKIDNLIKAIESAQKRKTVTGSDPFADDLKEALAVLKDVRKKGSIKPTQVGLSGPGLSMAAYLGMPPIAYTAKK